MAPLTMQRCFSAASAWWAASTPPSSTSASSARAACQPPARDERDARGRGFHVGDDVRGEDDDALAGQIREQVAEADALFGIEPGRGLVDDQELRIVEERLRDADALAHAAGKSAERALARIGEVHQHQQLVDTAFAEARVFPSRPR
jgi:hypothetical protein